MNYSNFLEANKALLIGYFLTGIGLPKVYPPSVLEEDELERFKSRLTRRMPDSVFLDLWHWDIRFEELLGDDWYFDATLGPESAIDWCADALQEIYVRKAEEYDIEIGREEYEDFDTHIYEAAVDFIRAWRANIAKISHV